MKLQTQKNRWSCLLTSLAMILDVDQEELIKEIGHDGSEFAFPELPDPYKRRSFHIQEMIDICFTRNIGVITIEAYPTSTTFPKTKLKEMERILTESLRTKVLSIIRLNNLYEIFRSLTCDNFVLPIDNEKRLNEYLLKGNGVFVGESLKGNPHAVAWNSFEYKIYDPCGEIKNKEDFLIHTFYLALKIE